MNMKHFHSFRSAVARLPRATSALLLLMTILPTLSLFAGGGFVPVQIQGGPVVEHRTHDNEILLFQIPTFSPMERSRNARNDQNPFDNIADNVQSEATVNDLNLTLYLDEAEPITQSSDPKVDIEVQVYLTDADFPKLRRLDSEIDNVEEIQPNSTPQLQLANNVIQHLPAMAPSAESAEFSAEGIGESSAVLRISAWPNPTEGIVNAEIQGLDSQMLNWQIVSQSGEVIQTREFSGTKASFDLSAKSAGIYYLLVSDGKKQLTKEILLRH
jgi:hypothetical protein